MSFFRCKHREARTMNKRDLILSIKKFKEFCLIGLMSKTEWWFKKSPVSPERGFSCHSRLPLYKRSFRAFDHQTSFTELFNKDSVIYLCQTVKEIVLGKQEKVPLKGLERTLSSHRSSWRTLKSNYGNFAQTKVEKVLAKAEQLVHQAQANKKMRNISRVAAISSFAIALLGKLMNNKLLGVGMTAFFLSGIAMTVHYIYSSVREKHIVTDLGRLVDF